MAEAKRKPVFSKVAELRPGTSGLNLTVKGPFGMSHQQALAQVTAQAKTMQQAQQGSFQSSTTRNGSEPHVAIAPKSKKQQKMMSSASESKETKEPAQYSGVDQRLQTSIIVDKPADNGYNWWKYGQKHVKDRCTFRVAERHRERNSPMFNQFCGGK